MKIIERILALMESKSLRPSDLADNLGIQRSVVSGWKSRMADPPAKYIVQISELLSVTPYFLLTGEKDSPIRNNSNLTDSLNSEKLEIINLWDKMNYINKTIVKGELYKCLKEQESTDENHLEKAN